MKPLFQGTTKDVLLERAFRLRPGESCRAFLMFFYLMGVVSTFILTRNVRDTLLLSRADLSILPFMYVAVAISVAPASYIYSRVADRSRRDRVIGGSLVLFALVLTLFYGVISRGLGNTAVYALLYVVVEIIGAISIIQFWTFAQDIYDSREAKRLFAFIGAGGVLSNITCGFAIHWAAPRVGPERLLLVAAVALLGCVGLVHLIARGAQAELERAAPKRTKIKNETQTIKGERHLELIAAMVAITFITVSIVDYQFKIAAKSAYSEVELSAFFGKFFAYTGIVASLMQFFVTGRLLERHGVVLSLCLLPLGLAAGAGSMLIPGVGLFAAGVLGKSAENIFRYTVNDASTQLLYVPVPAQLRARAKAFIDGILKPLSIGVAGLILAGLGRLLTPEKLAWSLSFVDLGLLAAWGLLIAAIRREYLVALVKTLRKRRIDFSTKYRPSDDARTAEFLKEGLESTAEAEVLAAIDLAGAIDADLRAELTALLGTGSKAVRLAALDRLSRNKLMDSAPVRALLEDADEEVRAAASQAIDAGGRAPALAQTIERLRDTRPRVRASAVGALYDHADPEIATLAHESLCGLIASTQAEHRADAARALASIQSDRPRPQHLALIADPDLEVRSLAIKCASTRWHEGLLLPVLTALSVRHTEVPAIRTLVEVGPSLEPALLAALSDPRLDLPVRRRVPNVIAILGGQRSLDLLMTRLDEEDTEMLVNVLRAAAKIRVRIEGARVDDAAIDRALHRVLAEAYRLLGVLGGLELEPEHLLHEAIVWRYRACLAVAFRLLGIRHPPKTMQLVYRNLDATTKSVRANALEVADNLLSKDESRLLLPLIEDRPAEEKVRVGQSLFAFDILPPDQCLRALLDDRHAWVVTCALHLVGERRLGGLQDQVKARMEAQDPVVRETAGWALGRLIESPA